MASRAMLPSYNVGGNTNQNTEDPSKRAKASAPGFLQQILNAIDSFVGDVANEVGFTASNQDRGSATATPDVLRINAQTTPPASSDYWGPDNPELALSHQNNPTPEFRFIGIAQWQPTAQGGNTNPPLIMNNALQAHKQSIIDRFPSLKSLTSPRNTLKPRSGPFVQDGVYGKKLLDSGENAEPSGVSSGSGGSTGSGGSGTRGGGITLAERASTF